MGVGLDEHEALHLAVGDGAVSEPGEVAGEHPPVAVPVDRGDGHRPVVEREQDAVDGDGVGAVGRGDRAAAVVHLVAGGDRRHQRIPVVGVDGIGEPLQRPPGARRAHLLAAGVERSECGLEVVRGERRLPGESPVVVDLHDDEALDLTRGDSPVAEPDELADEHPTVTVRVDGGDLGRPVVEREEEAVAGHRLGAVHHRRRDRAGAVEHLEPWRETRRERVPVVGVDRIGVLLDGLPSARRAHLLVVGAQRGEGGLEVVDAEARLAGDEAGGVDLDQLQCRDLRVLDGTVTEPDHVAAEHPTIAVEGHSGALVGDVIEPEEHAVLVEVGVLVRQRRAAIPLPVTGGEEGDVRVPVPLVGCRRHADRRSPSHRVVLVGGRSEPLQLEVGRPPFADLQRGPAGEPPVLVDLGDHQHRLLGTG